jgi:phosphatidylglycerophosphate synthase
MSIREVTSSGPNAALRQEARQVFAAALGLAAVAAPLLVLGGAFGSAPAAAGLVLFAGLVVALERRVAAHHPHPRLGLANRITLVRLGAALPIACRALDPMPLGDGERWLLAALAAAALALDGADGWAARRQGLASAFGARFDLEVDAFAVLVLSVAVVRADAAPAWVLAIGLMRYLYLGAARVVPLLRHPLPASSPDNQRRKAVAVVQGLALIATLAPATPAPVAAALCAVALGLLAYSFAADIAMLLSMEAGRASAD